MKCLVISDTHGDKDSLLRAVSAHPECEVLFFLGDGLSDLSEIRRRFFRLAVIAVKGNCDLYFDSQGEQARRIESITLEGVKITLTHGDAYGVKYDVSALYGLAENTGSDLILFGHTHESFRDARDINGARVTLFNPGSLKREYGRRQTYGVLTVKEGRADISLCELE